jgi:pimeloyl-ACP methyl ester carboxylesterase
MSKTPLVLLPGMLCDAALWSHQLTHLSEIADVSVGNLTAADTLAEMARAILRRAPERFALAGLSLGGIVAFEVMRQAPKRVTRLALLDTNARPPRPEQLGVWQRFRTMTRQGRFAEITEQHLLPVLVAPDRQQETALTTTIRQMAEHIGAEAFLRQLSLQEQRPDSRVDLPYIVCPTLVLAGRQDMVCPLDMHEEIAAAVPNATLVVIEHCGHLSSMEQPQAVTAALRSWLQRT